jgi:hypothetical protein
MTIHQATANPDLKTLAESLRKKPYIQISALAAPGDWLEIFDPNDSNLSSLLVKLVKQISKEEFERVTGYNLNPNTPYPWRISSDELDILVEQTLAELPVTDLIAA